MQRFGPVNTKHCIPYLVTLIIFFISFWFIWKSCSFEAQQSLYWNFSRHLSANLYTWYLFPLFRCYFIYFSNVFFDQGFSVFVLFSIRRIYLVTWVLTIFYFFEISIPQQLLNLCNIKDWWFFFLGNIFFSIDFSYLTVF